MMLPEYGVSNKLDRRIGRKLIPFFGRRMMHFEIDRPIVSISFDDFPKSVMENALPMLDAFDWKAIIAVMTLQSLEMKVTRLAAIPITT